MALGPGSAAPGVGAVLALGTMSPSVCPCLAGSDNLYDGIEDMIDRLPAWAMDEVQLGRGHSSSLCCEFPLACLWGVAFSHLLNCFAFTADQRCPGTSLAQPHPEGGGAGCSGRLSRDEF